MTISVTTILDVAGWSSSEAFAKFCDKPIISELRLLSFEGPGFLIKLYVIDLSPQLCVYFMFMAICFKVSCDFVAT